MGTDAVIIKCKCSNTCTLLSIPSYLYNTQPHNLCDFTGITFPNMPGMLFNRTLTEDDVALIKSQAVVECAPSTDIVTNAATQATHWRRTQPCKRHTWRHLMATAKRRRHYRCRRQRRTASLVCSEVSTACNSLPFAYFRDNPMLMRCRTTSSRAIRSCYAHLRPPRQRARMWKI